MFTGVKTNSGTLGFDAHIIENDETSIHNATEVESIMLHAQHAGKDTGFVTTTRITHATPARLHGNTTMDYLTTIADPWYFWKGSCTSKAHKPVTLSGNATFTKV